MLGRYGVLSEDEPMLLVLAEFIIRDNGSKTLSASSLVGAKAIVESDQQAEVWHALAVVNDAFPIKQD